MIPSSKDESYPHYERSINSERVKDIRRGVQELVKENE